MYKKKKQNHEKSSQAKMKISPLSKKQCKHLIHFLPSLLPAAIFLPAKKRFFFFSKTYMIKES